MLALLSVAAGATTLEDLLAEGEVEVVKSTPDGHPEQVTTYTHVDAPVDRVWAKLVDFDSYVAWMPQVAKSEVTARTGDEVDVSWSIKVPGPNVAFTAKYDLDPVNHVVTATGTSGAITGGSWAWRLTADATGTLVERTTYASAVVDNWIVRSFDDESHTLELALNAASPLVEARGLRVAIESGR